LEAFNDAEGHEPEPGVVERLCRDVWLKDAELARGVTTPPGEARGLSVLNPGAMYNGPDLGASRLLRD
jgi:hypothetical protein